MKVLRYSIQMTKGLLGKLLLISIHPVLLNLMETYILDKAHRLQTELPILLHGRNTHSQFLPRRKRPLRDSDGYRKLVLTMFTITGDLTVFISAGQHWLRRFNGHPIPPD